MPVRSEPRSSTTPSEEPPLALRARDNGVELSVHVRPRAACDAVGGTFDGCLEIRVRAASSDGAANEAVLRELARASGVRPRQVRLLKGARSRRKRIFLEGDPAALCSVLRGLARSSTTV